MSFDSYCEVIGFVETMLDLGFEVLLVIDFWQSAKSFRLFLEVGSMR